MFYALIRTNANIQRVFQDGAIKFYYTYLKKKDEKNLSKNQIEKEVSPKDQITEEESEYKKCYSFGKGTENNSSSSFADKHHVQIEMRDSQPGSVDTKKKVHEKTKSCFDEKRYSDEQIIPLFNSDLLNPYPQDMQGSKLSFQDVQDFLMMSQKNYEDTPKNCN